MIKILTAMIMNTWERHRSLAGDGGDAGAGAGGSLLIVPESKLLDELLSCDQRFSVSTEEKNSFRKNVKKALQKS